MVSQSQIESFIFFISGLIGVIILLWTAKELGIIKRRKEIIQLLINAFKREIGGKPKPKYNYEKVMDQIKYVTPPIALGTFNVGLYHYVKQYEESFDMRFGIFFLIASLIFYLMALLIGFGIGFAIEEPLELRKWEESLKDGQVYVIALLFMMAIAFDFLGILFLITIEFVNNFLI